MIFSFGFGPTIMPVDVSEGQTIDAVVFIVMGDLAAGLFDGTNTNTNIVSNSCFV
jgi:hypothetical protein